VENPFMGPKQARRLSIKAIAIAAEQINAKTAEGQRLFSVPIGLAEDVIACLETAGGEGEPHWDVEVKGQTDTEVTFLLRDPSCPFARGAA